jgi:hypothetical protein
MITIRWCKAIEGDDYLEQGIDIIWIFLKRPLDTLWYFVLVGNGCDAHGLPFSLTSIMCCARP